jgi:hypothetical protein
MLSTTIFVGEPFVEGPTDRGEPTFGYELLRLTSTAAPPVPQEACK